MGDSEKSFESSRMPVRQLTTIQQLDYSNQKMLAVGEAQANALKDAFEKLDQYFTKPENRGTYKSVKSTTYKGYDASGNSVYQGDSPATCSKTNDITSLACSVTVELRGKGFFRA